MWSTCHVCNGSGIHHGSNTINTKNSTKKENQILYCKHCNPSGEIINSLFVGQIWIEDNFFPLTPPQSPR